MNRFHSLAIATVMLFSLTALAQQNAAPPAGAKDEHAQQGTHHMPPVEQHLKMLAERLELTDAQQAKARPILQEMTDANEKVMQDENTPREERMAKMHAQHMKADKQLREFLTDEQKKKLDQLEREPHPGSHDHEHSATH
jgi:Spy/CpxP family protein refolding chaperone